MKILAIESSCDETAAAVVEDGRRVLSNVVASQVEEHKLYGGVVPEIASRRHCEAVNAVVRKALADAGLEIGGVDAVAVTYAPGLIGALLVGVNFAKGLSLSTRLPLVPVHHLRSHIASNYIAHSDLEPPFLCLVVSGGHSHIVEVNDYTDMRVIGKTRDDAAGEAFDKLADKYTTDDITVGLSGEQKESTKRAASNAKYAPIDEWVFSADRKAGDIHMEVIEESGLYITLYEETGRAAWLSGVDSALRSDDLDKKVDELQQTYPATVNEKSIAKVQ